MPRKTFVMTDAQHEKLLDACRPVPYIAVGGVAPRSPQENANDAWRALGDELGFVWDTVRPEGADSRVFSAEEKS